LSKKGKAKRETRKGGNTQKKTEKKGESKTLTNSTHKKKKGKVGPNRGDGERKKKIRALDRKD